MHAPISLLSLDEKDMDVRNCSSGMLDPITLTKILVFCPEKNVEKESAALKLLDSS